MENEVEEIRTYVANEKDVKSVINYIIQEVNIKDEIFTLTIKRVGIVNTATGSINLFQENKIAVFVEVLKTKNTITKSITLADELDLKLKFEVLTGLAGKI
jgi:hypothetical protein